MPQGRKVFIKTHGCQMNEYDSARMLDLLKEANGAELVTTAEEADLLLLNTCSIREKAQEKVFHQLDMLPLICILSLIQRTIESMEFV